MAERTTTQLMGATLLGGLVGAGAALLFAPRSGAKDAVESIFIV